MSFNLNCCLCPTILTSFNFQQQINYTNYKKKIKILRYPIIYNVPLRSLLTSTNKANWKHEQLMANCDTILLTGFGLFGDHTINPSWEVVKELQQNHQFPGYKIAKEELTVSYTHVDKTVPELWRKYKPHLVIHVGVSSYRGGVKIENLANRTGYNRPDSTEETHPTGCVVPDGPDAIKTGLDVSKMCEYVENQTGLNCIVSEDAGRFVCEYTYYTSLNIAQDRSLFVHVPKIDQPYSVAQSAQILHHIIKFAIDSQCLCSLYCPCKNLPTYC